MKWGILAAAVTAAALGVAAQASATVYTITYTGAVTSGFLEDYGVSYTDITGQAYSATYVVDTDTVGASLNAGSTYSYINGFGSSAPVRGSFSVVGHTYKAQDKFYGEQFEARSSGLSRLHSNVQGAGQSLLSGGTKFTDLYNTITSTVNELSDADVLTVPGSYVLDSNDTGVGFFQIYHENLGFFEAVVNLDISGYTVTLGDSGPVPEASTWALMIAGFGGVGAALRRRRPVAA